MTRARGIMGKIVRIEELIAIPVNSLKTIIPIISNHPHQCTNFALQSTPRSIFYTPLTVSKLIIRRIDVSSEDPSNIQVHELGFTEPAPADFVNDLNGVQREAVVATDGPVLVVAGAGS